MQWGSALWCQIFYWVAYAEMQRPPLAHHHGLNTSCHPLIPSSPCRKEKQEALLRQKNEETLRRLTAGQADGNVASTSGRMVSDVVAYRSVAEIPPMKELMISVSVGGARGVGKVWGGDRGLCREQGRFTCCGKLCAKARVVEKAGQSAHRYKTQNIT